MRRRGYIRIDISYDDNNIMHHAEVCSNLRCDMNTFHFADRFQVVNYVSTLLFNPLKD